MPDPLVPYFMVQTPSNQVRSNAPSISLVQDNDGLIMPLEEFKLLARIDSDHEDNTVEMFLRAAQDMFEADCRVCLMSKRYVQSQRWFENKRIELPLVRWPVTAINSIKYRDTSGNVQTIDPSNYTLVGLEAKPSIVIPNLSAGYEWPDTCGLEANIQVTFTAGYASADDIPVLYKKAVTEIAHYFYDFRTPVLQGQTINELPDGLKRIINRCRIKYIN